MKFGWEWIVLAILGIGVVIVLMASAGQAAIITVHDGDTITIDGERIRLHGVDAPELGQPFGPEARAFVAAEIQKGPIRIVRKDADKYGRTIAIVFIGRSSLNARLVEVGLAWAYVLYSETYTAHERAAQEARRGLWAICCPIAPWHWRTGYR